MKICICISLENITQNYNMLHVTYFFYLLLVLVFFKYLFWVLLSVLNRIDIMDSFIPQIYKSQKATQIVIVALWTKVGTQNYFCDLNDFLHTFGFSGFFHLKTFVGISGEVMYTNLKQGHHSAIANGFLFHNNSSPLKYVAVSKRFVEANKIGKLWCEFLIKMDVICLLGDVIPLNDRQFLMSLPPDLISSCYKDHALSL